MGFSWGDIITAAVPAIVSAGSSLLASSAEEDRIDAQNEQALAASREDQYLQLRLAALKAQYQGGGGGGGGAAGPDPNFISKADRVAAVAGQGELEQGAIQNLLAGLQTGYSLSSGG